MDFCGPTILDPASPCFVGATLHSNNVGEILALIHALAWFSRSKLDCTCILEYDSEYAALSVQRLYRGKANVRLVLTARNLYDSVAHKIVWRKVESHTGQFLNERADHLAELGANGIFCGRADIEQWSSTLKR